MFEQVKAAWVTPTVGSVLLLRKRRYCKTNFTKTFCYAILSPEMNATLKEICDIQNGYSFRSRLDTYSDGAVAVIQMKDLSDDNTVDIRGLSRVRDDVFKSHHYVKKGDLVFRSRGHQNTSAIINDDIENAVVSAPLFRIRIQSMDVILPEYLNWYIAQHEAQVFFASRAKGSFHTMITKEALENLKVAIPDIQTQQRIVRLAMLFEQEIALTKQIEALKKSYISTILMTIATKGKR